MTDQDLDTTTLATDRECLEIEAMARTRKVLHWPELVRVINRMRHWQARAEAAERAVRLRDEQLATQEKLIVNLRAQIGLVAGFQ